MKITGSECVGCPSDLGCIYEACPYYKVTRYYCDECEAETELYHFDGQELCADCILDRLDKVEESWY